MAESGIYDTLAVKRNGIKMACNAAVTILRVDQVRSIEIINNTRAGIVLGGKFKSWIR